MRSRGIPRHAAVNRQALVNQGDLVRNNFNHYDCFHGNWWGRYPGAWRAAGWTTAAAVYGTATWGDYCYSGYSRLSLPNRSTTTTARTSSTKATPSTSTAIRLAPRSNTRSRPSTIADTGKQAEASKEEEWLPLGVFAMVQGEQSDGNDLFQLAVNKAGTIRGNYYNALSDTTLPVYGSVDKKTQRAAWTVGDRKEPIYEAGFANLTKSETTMLVHFGKDRTQQWTLIRIDQSAEPK